MKGYAVKRSISFVSLLDESAFPVYDKVMRNSTLCYLEQGDKYLMLHRVKKENDLNHDKWIGVGGGFEGDESPDECLRREVLEETGLTLRSFRFRGVVTFVSNEWEAEQMFLFTSDDFTGELIECDEGNLEWVEKSRVTSLPIWEGDKLFLRLLREDAPPFLMTLHYEGDALVYASLNGNRIK